MSIFSGWDGDSLAALKAALSGSPQGLAALLAMGLVGVAAVLIVGFFVSRQIGGFFAHVQEEEERQRQEEQADAPGSATDRPNGDEEG